MHVRTITIAALLVAATHARAHVSGVPVIATIDGELTDSDPLAFDAGGANFTVDVVQFTVDMSDLYFFGMHNADPDTQPGFVPFFMVYQGGTFNFDDWQAPPPEASGTHNAGLVLQAGLYDLVLTTLDFNPTPLGAYSFIAQNSNGATFTVVPAPGSIAMLGVGGVGLLARRRRRA